MEIDPEKHKLLMVDMLHAFKTLESQLLAHKMVLHALKLYHSLDQEEMDQALEISLNSPALQKMMNKKYDEGVEMLIKQFDAAILEEELSKWLRDWKRQSPPN
jgi:hypothetical protein